MELYEIIKKEQQWSHYGCGYFQAKISVITATTDKNMANQMLEIYQANCISDDESYEIRTLSKEN